MYEASSNERSRADNPFKALGNETRLEILRVLYEHRLQFGHDEKSLPYSELREHVGIEDKGNFNYHLRQLKDQFVDGDDEGYQLTFAGFEIAKVIDVDAWADHEPRDPIELDSSVCHSTLVARYEDGVFEVSADDTVLFAHAVRPTGASDRVGEDLLDVMTTLWRHTNQQMLVGICPYCQTETTKSIEIASSNIWDYTYSATCPTCGPIGGSHVGAAILEHPAVISFYWNHGIDIRAKHIWELGFVDDEAVTVLNENPSRLRIDVEIEDDRLEVTIDETAEVIDIVVIESSGPKGESVTNQSAGNDSSR
ncbi:winged helix-turn-helix domain-containing protein [Natronococcus sp. A-GB7]|uniref:winged helix-turn-helix domain-containing protein n=1 Tax=Natronococcus sp. A-GB7 TaxID=3037649 RepID=UPI00241D6048|nr:winged helix-turn-helix domain-containing protein [Natronococcus sp. A-GB7]MDG5821939.1 winged helix-turn-helix domain-containing protein [Natronococcus sp. A-GB7]